MTTFTVSKDTSGHLIPMIIIGIVILVFGRELLAGGAIRTHDAHYHLGRIATYYTALRDGHLPVRWGGELNLGFGYPVFMFNYPLGNMLAVAFLLTGFSVETTFSLVYLVAYAGGIIGAYYWHLPKFGRSSALFGAIVYATAPFTLLNIFVRGAIGETMSLAVIPWLMLAIDKAVESPSRVTFLFLSAITTLWLFSHNVSVYILLPTLVLYGLVRIIKTDKGRTLASRFLFTGAAVLVGIAMSLWFWLPALAEKKYTVLDTIPSNVGFSQQYPTTWQLIWSKWGYGLSIPGPNDDLSFAVGEVIWIVFITSLIILIKKRKELRQYTVATCFGGIFVLALILMNRISLPIAQYIPLFNLIQHPWRLLQITTIAGLYLAAFVASRISKQLPLWIILAAVMVFSLQRSMVIGRFHNPDLFYYHFPLTTSGEEEHLTIWFDQIKNYPLQEKVTLAQAQGLYEIDSWKTTEHRYRIHLDGTSRVVERTMYFPGWKLFVDGKKQDIQYQYKDYPGLITYGLPKGDHTIRTVFTEDTPARRTGDVLSLIGIGIWMVFFIKQWTSVHKKIVTTIKKRIGIFRI